MYCRIYDLRLETTEPESERVVPFRASGSEHPASIIQGQLPHGPTPGLRGARPTMWLTVNHLPQRPLHAAWSTTLLSVQMHAYPPLNSIRISALHHRSRKLTYVGTRRSSCRPSASRVARTLGLRAKNRPARSQDRGNGCWHLADIVCAPKKP
jgi:hypothetical protein